MRGLKGKLEIKTGLVIPVILTIIFLVLKVTGCIAWKWVWVLCPIWIWAILFIIEFIVLIRVIRTLDDNDEVF